MKIELETPDLNRKRADKISHLDTVPTGHTVSIYSVNMDIAAEAFRNKAAANDMIDRVLKAR
jgi:hypothetical protein